MKYVIGGFLALAMLVGGALLAQDETPEVSGEYAVSGEGSKGNYTGTAIIAQKGQAIFVTFTPDKGEGEVRGFGVIKDGYLTYGFQIADGVGMAAIYKIDGNKLIGTYIEPDGTVFPEVMVKGGNHGPSIRAALDK